MSQKISSLPRLFVPSKNIESNIIEIKNKSDIDKIRQVLRMHKEDKLRVFDGKGQEYLAQIVEITKEQIICTIIEKLEIPEITKPQIILAQALTRSSKLEEVIKMNTEIGISEFVFFESDHSIVKCKDYKEKKIERFEKIAIEATRQSEQSSAPLIQSIPIKFNDLVNIEADYKLFLFERDTDKPCQFLQNDIEKLSKNVKILVIIGPEGGFSDREIEFAKENFTPLHLNMPVLRTETAGVVIASYILLNLTKEI
jgi:16S rRNA (uracil1498-N3)-methyltransferase